MRCHCKSNYVYVECNFQYSNISFSYNNPFFEFFQGNKWNSSNEKEKDQLKSCRVPCSKNVSKKNLTESKFKYLKLKIILSQIACGHVCGLICHSGVCLVSKNCQEKVTLKCACKTLKKTILCNQISAEKDLKENKKSNAEQKFILSCNEKCESRSKKNEAKDTELKEADSREKTNTKRKDHFYFLIGLLAILVSIVVYFLYNFFI